jgi:hypothetical protein
MFSKIVWFGFLEISWNFLWIFRCFVSISSVFHSDLLKYSQIPSLVHASCINYRQAELRIFGTSYMFFNLRRTFLHIPMYVQTYNVHCITDILSPSFNFVFLFCLGSGKERNL